MNCITLKLAVMGDTYVGKTSLLNREIYKTYNDFYEKTFGIGYYSKIIKKIIIK